MSEKLKVTRRRLTVADRLKMLDDLIGRERERLAANTAKAESLLEQAQTAQRVRLAELDGKRAKIVADALAAAKELERQAGGAS